MMSMPNPTDTPPMDLQEALRTFDRLQLEGGDLGAIFWHRISFLVQDAAQYQARALTAEAKLGANKGATASLRN